jgi:uncharacterized protein with FMN-binding domain
LGIFDPAGGDQGAAHTDTPRAAALLAVASSSVVPSGVMRTRSRESPMPVSGEKNASASASVREGAYHAPEAPKPLMLWCCVTIEI